MVNRWIHSANIVSKKTYIQNVCVHLFMVVTKITRYYVKFLFGAVVKCRCRLILDVY